MRFSELGECNHNSAAGDETLERVTKKFGNKYVMKHVMPQRITAS
jgi:hypothetical protein